MRRYYDRIVAILRSGRSLADGRQRVEADGFPQAFATLGLPVLPEDEAEWRLLAALIDYDPARPPSSVLGSRRLPLFGADDPITPGRRRASPSSERCWAGAPRGQGLRGRGSPPPERRPAEARRRLSRHADRVRPRRIRATRGRLAAVTRFVIDSGTALALAEDSVEVSPEHELYAPTLWRSQTLSAVYEARGARRAHGRRGPGAAPLCQRSEIHPAPRGRRPPPSGVGARRAARNEDDLIEAEYVALAQLQKCTLVSPDRDGAEPLGRPRTDGDDRRSPLGGTLGGTPAPGLPPAGFEPALRP